MRRLAARLLTALVRRYLALFPYRPRRPKRPLLPVRRLGVEGLEGRDLLGESVLSVAVAAAVLPADGGLLEPAAQYATVSAAQVEVVQNAAAEEAPYILTAVASGGADSATPASQPDGQAPDALASAPPWVSELERQANFWEPAGAQGKSAGGSGGAVGRPTAGAPGGAGPGRGSGGMGGLTPAPNRALGNTPAAAGVRGGGTSVLGPAAGQGPLPGVNSVVAGTVLAQGTPAASAAPPTAAPTVPVKSAAPQTTNPPATTALAHGRLTALPLPHLHGRDPKGGPGGLSGVDPNVSATEGVPFNGAVASFSDSDNNTNPNLYSASINWGDNTAATSGTVSGSNPFTVTGTHTYAETGTFTITTTVTDNQDQSQTTITSTASVGDGTLSWQGGNPSFSWTTTSPSNPTVTTPSNQTNAEGSSVNLQVQATDPNGYTLTYDAVGLPAGLSINSASGLITGTVDYAAAEDFGGSYTPTVTVADGHGGSASTSFNWTITDTVRPPVVTSPGNQTSTAGTTTSLQISATDADGNPLTYSATGLPSGLTIDDSTGLISGTIDPSAAATAPYAVTVTADDGQGNAPSQTFDWLVTPANLPPVLTNPGSQSNGPGDSVSLALSASDADGDTLTYTASNLPGGLSIDPGSGTISGTVLGSAASATPYAVTVTASDGIASSSQTFNWTIGYVSVTSPGNQANTDGDAVSLQMTGSDYANGTLTYTATGLPAGLTISSSGLISGTVSTGDDASSPYTTTVTATDAGNYHGSTTFTWTVAHLSLANPGSQFSPAGSAVSLQLSGNDADGDHLTYSAVGLPGGLSLNTTSGLITGTPTAADVAAGPFQVTATASDATHSVSQAFTWQVTPQVVVQSPGTQNNATGDSVALAISATDGAGLPLTYSATGLPGGLAIDPNTGEVTGTLATSAASAVPYSVTVSASDGTTSGSSTFPWTVGHLAITAPAAQSNVVGDRVSLPVRATDHDGDLISYQAVGLPPGLEIDPNTGLISGSIAPGADSASPYTVTVTASDGSHSAGTSFSWTVGHLSLANPGNQSGTEGSAASLQLSGRDADGDPLTYSATGLPAGLSVNSVTGLISGTPSVGDAASSPYRVTVSAADAAGNSVSQTFTWTVVPHVQLANPGNQSAADGMTVSLALSGSDPDNDSLTYSATGLPPGLALNGNVISGTLSGTADTGSPYTVTVTASDGHGNSATQTFSWVVGHIQLNNPGDQTNAAGDSVSLSVSGRDHDSDSLTYSATGLPPGLTDNSATGLITGTVTLGDDANSPYTTTVTASDGHGNSVSQTFTWTVNHMTLTNPGSLSNAAGTAVSLQLSGHDADNDTLTYSAVGLPPGLTVSSSGLISGTPSAGDSVASPYAVTVSASDAAGNSSSQTFSWAVTPHVSLSAPSLPPTTEGGAVSVGLNAHDADNDTLNYAASGLPAGLSLNTSTGIITGTPAAGSAGTYTVTASASDGANTSRVVFPWTVTPHIAVTSPGTQWNAVQDSVSLPLTANDPDFDPVTFSATGLPAGLSVSGSSITGTVSAGDDTTSPYHVLLTASDGHGYSDSVPFTWVVGHVLVSSPGNQANTAGDAVSLTVSARDNDHETLSYSATGLPAGLTINSGTGLISGTLTAASVGAYTVTVTATDTAQHSGSQTFAWLVTGPLTLTNPGNQSNSDGDAVAVSVPGSDPDGDNLAYSATGLPAGLSINSSTGLISGTVSSGDETSSPYSVTVSAADGHGHSVSQSFTWTIGHLSLANPGNQSGTEGASVSLQLSGYDADNDTLTYSATGLPSGLTVSSGGLISGAPAAGTATSSPYHVTVTATDPGSHSVSQSLLWAVAPAVALGNPGSQSSADGDSVSLQMTGQDSNQQTLTYSATGLPPGLTISNGGLISGTVGTSDDGSSPYSVTVTARDTGGYSSSQTFSWVVSHLGLANPGTQTTAAGSTVSLQLVGRDTDQDTLTYSANGLPSGLTISSGGLISGTLGSSADGNSPYTVTATVSDPGSHTASQTFTWVVTSQVALADPGDQSNQDGDTVSLQLSASDGAGKSLAYSATGLPSGLSINSGTGLISGTVSSGDDANSPYVVTVTAADGTASRSQTFNWTLSAAVTVSPVSGQSNVVGDSVALQVSGYDADGDTVSYSATGLPAGLSINSSTGLISGTLSTGDDTGSPYSVTVTASDGKGQTASQSFTWAVGHFALSNPGAQSNREGDSVSLQMAGHDPDGDTLSYSATGLPSGLAISSGGLISGTLAAGSSSSSPYAVTVTASDGHGHTVSQAFTWTVSHVLLANPGDQTNSDGQAVSLAVSGSDPDGDALTYSATGLPTGLSIKANTGLISGTISSTADTNSPYAVTVTATDGSGHSNSQSFNWAVNIAPTISITDQGDQSNADGAVVSVPITATDPFGLPLSFSATGLPSGLAMNSSSGVISGTVGSSADSGSPYTVTVTATDGTNTVTDSFTWTVAALSLTNPGNQSSAAGTAVSLQLSGSDADGDTLSYSATGLPAGLGVNSRSGLIGGTPAAGVTGVSVVTVTASDGSHSVSQTFDWAVTEVGVTAPATQTNTEGDTVSLQVQASGPAGKQLSYSAAGLPAGLTISSTGGLISGTISAGDAASGPYTVTVAASDGTAASSQQFTWNVNPYVTLTSVSDQSGVEGSPVSVQLQATDPAHDTLTYSAGGLPPGLSINSSSGLISGVLSTGDAVGGSYPVTVTASDSTYSTSQTFNWTVTPASAPPAPSVSNPGTQNTTAGASVSLQVQATDPGGYPLTYSATGLPDGLDIDPFAGTITGTVADDAVSRTPYNVTVTADNGDGGTSSQTFLWSVAPAPITAQGGTVSGIEGNDTGGLTVATFTTADPNSTASEFTATVNWADGSSDIGMVTGGAGTFTVTDGHTYAEPGIYAVTVEISASDGATATASCTATVADAALTVSGGYQLGAVHQQSAQMTLASFTDGNPNATTADWSGSTVNWGDGTGNLAATISSLGGDLYGVGGTHAYTQDGTYTVTLTVVDKEGASATTTSTVIVGDFYAGQQATLGALTFTDANSQAPVSDFTGTVAWGDGSPNTSLSITGANGTYTLGATTHTYAVDSLGQPGGVYQVTVTVTDDDGNTLTGTDNRAVVRPPMVGAVNSILAAPGLALTNVEVAAFTDPNLSDTGSEFQATIAWGDGTSSAGTITGSGGLFHVLGSHTYSDSGVFVISVEIAQAWGTFENWMTGDRYAWDWPNVDEKVVLQGPTAVPGNSDYLYTLTNLPKGAQFTDLEVTATSKQNPLLFVIRDYKRGGFYLAFKNIPGTLDLVPYFKDASGKVWRSIPMSTTVNVVQVNVSTPKKNAFVPSPSATVSPTTVTMPITVDGKPGDATWRLVSSGKVRFSPDLKRILVGPAYPGTQVALSWAAKVAIVEPDQKSVKNIHVGFIQYAQQTSRYVLFEHSRLYSSLPGVHKEGWGLTDFPAKGGPWAGGPWFDPRPVAHLLGKDEEATITSLDYPTVPVPVIYNKDTARAVSDKSSYVLNVAATTIENPRGEHFFQEATASWSVNLDGYIKNGMWESALRNSSPVTPPDEWGAPSPPVISELVITKQSANKSAESETWSSKKQ